MAIIPQKKLFGWTEIQSLGDLERLRLVLDYMPDEELMVKLEKERKNGRNDYPVRAMWNSILAGIVFQHDTVEKLRRELSRNGQLREICGFTDQTPSPWSYTRFLKTLMQNEILVERIFDRLVQEISQLLPDYGKSLAMDSKAIPSFAQHKNKNQTPDGRRDTDANYGKKEYRGINKDGKPWEKVVKWFGYKLHLIVDTIYELPVLFTLTKASASDVVEGRKMVSLLNERLPEMVNRAEVLTADRGYDDTELITTCWDQHKIKPVIDIRNMWRDPDQTRLLRNWENVAHDYKGTVFCYCPLTGKKRGMLNGGFEKSRGTLKKLCPAIRFGLQCQGENKCRVRQGIRIPLAENRRIFTPIDRASYKWKTEYNKRTAVERVNSRLDVSFGFELHTIRGMKKMKIRCGLAFCVMLAMAFGRIREKEGENYRSLVKAV